MCKALIDGGQRCAGHTRAGAKSALNALRERGPRHLTPRETAALVDYASTPAGGSELTRMAEKMDLDPQHYTETMEPAAFLRDIIRKGENKRAANMELARAIRHEQGLLVDRAVLAAPAIEPEDREGAMLAKQEAEEEFSRAKREAERLEGVVRAVVAETGADPEQVKETVFALDSLAMGRFEQIQQAPETVVTSGPQLENAAMQEMLQWEPNHDRAGRLGVAYVEAVVQQMIAGARKREATDFLDEIS